MTVQIPDSLYEQPATSVTSCCEWLIRHALLPGSLTHRRRPGCRYRAAGVALGSRSKVSRPLGDEPDRFAYSALVTEGYLAAMDIPLLSGRDIERSDLENDSNIAVVNRAMAERFWPQVGRGWQALQDRR